MNKTKIYETLQSEQKQKVLPITIILLQNLYASRNADAKAQAILAGQIAQAGDGWHSSTYRIMQDQLWVKAALANTTAGMIEQSEVLEIPQSADKVEQGHSVEVRLDRAGFEEYGRPTIKCHIVSPIDATVIGSLVNQIPHFANESNLSKSRWKLSDVRREN